MCVVEYSYLRYNPENIDTLQKYLLYQVFAYLYIVVMYLASEKHSVPFLFYFRIVVATCSLITHDKKFSFIKVFCT